MSEEKDTLPAQVGCDEEETLLEQPKKVKTRIYTEGREDIRYRGPLSYRAFKILGWLCIVASQVVILMRLDVRMDPSMSGTFETPINILSTVSGMSVPLMLFANFALILNASEGYHRQLIRYLLTLSGVAALSIFLYERYIIGSAAVLLGSREMAESAIEILFRISVPSGFAAYNLFVDLFLCALLMFFMNYRPKHVFKGRGLVIFRLFSLIPILYEVASFVLKVLSIEGKIRLPMIVFPFLTVKPPVTFLVFIILVLYIKNRERRFLRHDRSLEDYQEFLQTNRNSFHFSRFAAIILAFAGLFDLLCLFVGMLALWIRDPEILQNASETLARMNSLGIGQSLGLLLLSPVMLLFSYTRRHKHRLLDSFIPIAGIALIVMVYIEGFYQFIAYLPEMIGYLSGR